jgi:hypothetical protein
MMFPNTKTLVKIIENHKWTLYQIPLEAPPWEEIEKRWPAKRLEIGHQCIFAPIPKKGQSLRDAYSITKGLGPSLIIDPSWEGIEEVYRGKSSIERENEILFSRLWFANERCADVISPRTRDNWDPSAVSIKLPFLIETFERYFRIVTAEEYRLRTPIPMPFHPEDN